MIHLLKLFLGISVLASSWSAGANELYNKSEKVPIRIRPAISENEGSSHLHIEVCTSIDENEQCNTYPDLSSINMREADFTWEYYLNRCNGFILNNRFAFGAMIFRSALILGVGVVTGTAVIPTTGTSLMSFLGTATGFSGTSAVALGSMANIGLSESPYPDYKIPIFPSDLKEKDPMKDVYFSGMDRAQQMINFVLSDENQAKVLSDLDILAFQEIIAKCNDPRLKEDLIINYQKKCLHSCH